MKLQILVTGGTFDKEYDERNGELVFRETHLPEMLARGRSLVETSVKTLMLIDSLEMTESDRETVVQNCLTSDANRIVITHGTDTMVETARVLAGGTIDKTIVLTGAMIPCKIGESDGLFNLGCALAFAQTLPTGVYIVMGGTCFKWDNVRKNRSMGRFENVFADTRTQRGALLNNQR